ncbi:hypothetical protein D3C86_2139800 [compost metagenome]
MKRSPIILTIPMSIVVNIFAAMRMARKEYVLKILSMRGVSRGKYSQPVAIQQKIRTYCVTHGKKGWMKAYALPDLIDFNA